MRYRSVQRALFALDTITTRSILLSLTLTALFVSWTSPISMKTRPPSDSSIELPCSIGPSLSSGAQTSGHLGWLWFCRLQLPVALAMDILVQCVLGQPSDDHPVFPWWYIIRQVTKLLSLAITILYFDAFNVAQSGGDWCGLRYQIYMLTTVISLSLISTVLSPRPSTTRPHYDHPNCANDRKGNLRVFYEAHQASLWRGSSAILIPGSHTGNDTIHTPKAAVTSVINATTAHDVQNVAKARGDLHDLLVQSETAAEVVLALSKVERPPPVCWALPVTVSCHVMLNVIQAAFTILSQTCNLRNTVGGCKFNEIPPHPVMVYETILEFAIRMSIDDALSHFHQFSHLHKAFIQAFERSLNNAAETAPLSSTHLDYCISRSTRMMQNRMLLGLVDDELLEALINLRPTTVTVSGQSQP